MYNSLQKILFLLIIFNSFILRIRLMEIGISSILISLSLLIYCVRLFKVTKKLDKEFFILVLFFITIIAFAIVHGIATSDLFYLISAFLHACYILVLYELAGKQANVLKYSILIIYLLYILDFYLGFELGTRNFVSSFGHDLNPFTYSISYFTLILFFFIKPRWYKYIVLLSLVTLSLALSRGALIVLLIPIVVFYLKDLSFKKIIGFSGIVALVAFILSYIGFFDNFLLRFRSIFDSSIYSSRDYRLSVFFDGIQHLLAYPFGTGYGPESFSDFFWRYTDITYSGIMPIDNSYILVAYTAGIIPLLLLLLNAFLILKKKNLFVSLSLIVWLLHLFLDDAIFSHSTWISFGILYVLSLLNDYKNS